MYLSIDVGNSTGIAYLDEHGFDTMHVEYSDLLSYYYLMYDIIQKYLPDVVGYSYTYMPSRPKSTQSLHFKMAIVELICAKQKIKCVSFPDSTCKKAVIGKGNASKEEVKEWAKKLHNAEIDDKTTQDEFDSMMFAEYMRITL